MLSCEGAPSQVADRDSNQFDPNPRSVAKLEDSRTLTLASRGNNTQDECQQDRSASLGTKLTGCRLFNTSVILGFGTAKAVYSYHGQAVISTTLDWIAGAALALMYAFILRQFFKLYIADGA
jgi:hypothetical protein